MEISAKKTIAIIGTGPSGLVSAKEALERGFVPTIFEKAPHIGGLWHPKTGGTWPAMQANTSRYTCVFSDFSWPEPAPDFPSQKDVIKYLSDYHTHFGLQAYTLFNTTVNKVDQVASKWRINYSQADVNKSEDFDFIIIATGVYSRPHIPSIKGQEEFKGKIMHSFNYKGPESVEGENVVVVGGAFSGSEVANDLCTGNKKVTNIIKNPLWVVPRYIADTAIEGEPKVPIDMFNHKRVKVAASKDIPPEEFCEMRNKFYSNMCNQGDISPELKIGVTRNPAKITITDSYLSNIQQEKLKIKKGEIDYFDEKGMVMKDGTRQDADCVIFSTGFLLELPFFESKVLDTLGYDRKDQLQPLLLHKNTFHPGMTNMAFVGLYRGSFFGTLEMQARWATLAFSDQKEYMPTTEQMEEGLKEELKVKQKQPRPQFPHGSYLAFTDALAKECKVLPDFEALETENPELYKKLWFNPLIPAHYRLKGIGKKEELAMKQIEDVAKISKKYPPTKLIIG